MLLIGLRGGRVAYPEVVALRGRARDSEGGGDVVRARISLTGTDVAMCKRLKRNGTRDNNNEGPRDGNMRSLAWRE